MPNSKNEETETAILLRLIEANPQLISPAVAEAILTVEIPERETKKLAKLAAKARAGNSPHPMNKPSSPIHVSARCLAY